MKRQAVYFKTNLLFALAMALRDAKANVELHLVPKGGHGVGMTPGNKAAETWPGLLAPWLKEHL